MALLFLLDIHINMSRPEEEVIQTSHDANLFDDDDDDMEDDNMENAAKFQTPTQVNHSLTRTTRMDKREASWMDIDGAPGLPPTESERRKN
jgi:hypothetical protein